MTRYAIVSAALLLAVPAAAQDPVQSTDPAPTVLDPQSNPEDFDLARKKVIDCAGEKFVFAWGAGANPTKVTLCSKKDATTDEVVQMLEEAATKVEQTSIAEDRRVAILQQIRAKISELRGSAAADPAGSAVADAAVNTPKPAPAIQAPVAAPQPVARAAIAPPVSPPVTPVAARRAVPAKPRLAFECYTPGDIGSGGPCVMLERDTRLTVTARDPLAGGASLRFVRNGNPRAEVALAALRRGQSLRVVVPRELCSGVVGAETRIEVVAAGQILHSIGPYELRC